MHKYYRENPKFWGARLAQGHTHFFLWIILWWALENPNSIPNLKSLAPAVAEILKGNGQILESSNSPGPCPLFFSVGFYDGP